MSEILSVVTPTIGRAALKLCFDDARRAAEDVHQKHGVNVEHIVAIDGPMYADDVEKIVNEWEAANEDTGFYQIYLMQLPFNTGRAGAIVRSAATLVTRGQYVVYLDDDNRIDADMWSSFVGELRKSEHTDIEASYCLRRMTCDSETVDDRCESLGPLHHAFAIVDHYLIDTNTYCFRGDFARKMAPLWSAYSTYPWGDDRLFFALAAQYIGQFLCIRRSLCTYTCNANLLRAIQEGNERLAAAQPELFVDTSAIVVATPANLALQVCVVRMM
jgi:hypothetical protein